MPSELIFLYLTDTGPVPNPHAVVARCEEAFAARVAQGVLRPLVLPCFFYGITLLVIYLCIPHTKSPTIYAARWPVLLAIISSQLKVLRETSSGNVGVASLRGVASGFVMILASTWLVWCKPHFDARRVQKRKKQEIFKHAIERLPDSQGKDSLQRMFRYQIQVSWQTGLHWGARWILIFLGDLIRRGVIDGERGAKDAESKDWAPST